MQTQMEFTTAETAGAAVVEAWDRFIEDPQAPWCSEHPSFRELVNAIGRLRATTLRERIREAGIQAGTREFNSLPLLGR